MGIEALAAAAGAFLTLEASLVAGVWLLSTKIGGLESKIASLSAHREAHDRSLVDATARIDRMSARIGSIGERMAVLEDRAKGDE